MDENHPDYHVRELKARAAGFGAQVAQYVKDFEAALLLLPQFDRKREREMAEYKLQRSLDEAELGNFIGAYETLDKYRGFLAKRTTGLQD